MNTLTLRIFMTAAVGLGISWLFWDALNVAPRPGDFLVLGSFGVSLVWNLFLANTLERQLHWLNKGHTRQRATEVLVPPKGLRQLGKVLNDKELTEEAARGALIRLDRYIKHYLLTAARLTPSLVVLVGLSCSVAMLVATHVSLTKSEPLPQLPTQWLMMHLLSYGFIGLILGASLWAGTTQLRSIAETTLRKAGLLIQQTGALARTPSVRRFPTPALVWVGALFPLALIPIAGIQSYNLYTLIVEKGKVVSLSETQTTLEHNVTELKTKLDENTKDSDKLASTLRDQKETISKLEATLAQQKKNIASLTEKNKQAESDLKNTQETLMSTQADLKKAQTELTQGQKKLADALKEKDTLTRKFKEAENTLAKTKSAAATRETELTAALEKLEETNDLTRNQLTESRTELEAARKKHAALLARLQIIKPDTKGMHPAIKGTPDGKLVVSSDILFNGKSAKMSAIAEGVLSDIANRMSSVMSQASPEAILIIAAHTDIVPPGNGGDNNILTAEQASHVADIFAAQGITRRRLIPIGFGQHQEQDARLTEEAFAANRRVEFYVLPQLIARDLADN